MKFSWFKKAKAKTVTTCRAEVDTIRRVFVDTEKVVKKTKKPSYQGLLALLVFIILFGLSFFGTVTAVSIKNKAGVAKMFQQGKYLVIFQNNAEMRPTGGFIGSFAVVDFDGYKVANIDFNTNIFKLDDAFTKTTQIATPVPLNQINQNKWALRDSNFAISYPQTASDIQWFYEQETGKKVDGVIALNATIVQDLLKLTGPIYLAKYESTITADNFLDEMAQKIEKEYFYDGAGQTENEPKTILKDLMPVLIEKTLRLPKYQLLKFGLMSMDKKLVLLQSNNPVVQQSILQNNWGGAVRETSSDYLMVNNANITDLTLLKNGGAKTSLKVKESIDYQVEEGSNGLQSNLILTRSHTGSYAWPDGINMNWTRILVPVGSTLIKAELNGQEITSKVVVGPDSGKTSFGLWINTNPQTSSVLKLSYNLPISANNYSLLIQNQPGNLGDNLKISLKNRLIFNGILDQDRVIK